MLAVKAIREAKPFHVAGDGSQFADAKPAKQCVSLVVVHAADQPWSEAPTKAALDMVPMLRDLRDDTSAILPAGLHMVEASPHYAFPVACTAPKSPCHDGSKSFLPCQKVLALVRSSRNSKPNPLGSGFKLFTPGIEDLLNTEDPTGNASQMKHTLSAMCMLTYLPQYRLDPPRGGSQHALVNVTAKTDDSFVVESAQLLSSDDAAQAKQSMHPMQARVAFWPEQKMFVLERNKVFQCMKAP